MLAAANLSFNTQKCGGIKVKTMGSSTQPNSRFKIAAPAVVLAGALGFAVSAQAGDFPPDCTIANWGDNVGLSDDFTGYQGSENRRYGGPCGLRVPFDDAGAAYLIDPSPMAEADYIARFYAFLNNAGDEDIIIFAAQDDDGEDQVRVWYNVPAAGDISLQVFDANDEDTILTFEDVGSGWHSIEFSWSSDASAEIAFTVDGMDDEVATVDTSGILIAEAQLGNVEGTDTGGYVDFDDFVSNRMTRPGRLLVGDANDDGQVNVLDVLAVYDELGGDFAPGQPDCNEDGGVNVLDTLCVYDSL